MALLSGVSAGILVLFVLLEMVANSVGLYAASRSLPGFTFTNKRAILIAGALYSVLHIVGGFVLAQVLSVGIFSGTGLLIGYFIDVGLLFATDKILKDFEIKEREALFTGAFLLIFCWGVAWFLMLIALGSADLISLKSIIKI